MSTLSMGVGLVSGLPIDDLVESLMELQRRPMVRLQQRLGTLVSRRTALLQISAQILSIQNIASRLSDATLFRAATASSSNESTILASATSGAAYGEYTFTVQNLASSYQVISTGFATRDASLVGVGTLTIETAEARLDRPTPLSVLNGGAGVRAGSIHITDRAGAGADIDLRGVTTIAEVVSAVNGQSDANVHARVEGDRLVIEDRTGLSTGRLVVSEVGSGHAAADLGLLVEDVGGVIAGRRLVTLSEDTRLVDLNDGNGIRVLKAQKDLRISLADGTALDYDLSGRLAIELRDNGDGTFTDLSTPLSVLNRGAGVGGGTIRVTNRAGKQVEIDLSAARTVRDVSTAAEWADLDMTVAVSGARLIVTDNSTGEGSTEISDVSGTTAEALGIVGSSSNGMLKGDDVYFIETVGDLLRVISSHADNTGGAKLRVAISANGPGLTLTDNTLGGGVFEVEARNGSQTAYDLGLVGRVSGETIESRRLLGGMNTVLLRSLNGGSGVSQRLTLDTSLAALHHGAGIPAGQVRVTLRDGTQVTVDLSQAGTVRDVKAAFESASAELSVSVSGSHLVVTDGSVGAGQTPVSELSIEDVDSTTAAALGIAGTAPEDALTGGDLFADPGDIRLTDRLGNTAVIDLSGAQTLAEVVAGINASAVQIRAAVSGSGLGIELTDLSGGSGSLTIEDVGGGTTAADLGIAVSATQDVVSSGNLQRQYVSAATRLSALGSDRGVPSGKFRITDSSGAGATVDLSQGNEVVLQDVIDEINSRGIGVVARVNDTGDGLLLEDTAGGAGRLTVTEEGGSVAAALGILGQAEDGEAFIDGSFESRIEVVAGDTLDDVLTKIRAAGAPVNATIISDGTESRPYRLSMTSDRSGRDGELAIDVGTTDFSFDTLMEARDANVLFGSPGADAPVVLTSSTNSLQDVISGVRLDLVGRSETPVTITVAQDADSIAGDVSGFVTAFNAAIAKIDELTRYDAESQTRSVLTGDQTAHRVRRRLLNMVTGSVAGLSPVLSRLSAAGITLSGGDSLRFDEQAFRETLERDPEAMIALFTHEEIGEDGERVVTGFGGLIKDDIARLTSADIGVIPIREESIRESERLLSDRISQMEVLLGRRRERLLSDFYAMESALARLQSQQMVLSQLAILTVPTGS